MCIEKYFFSVMYIRHRNSLCGRASGDLKTKMGFDVTELCSSENSIQRCLLCTWFPVSSHYVHLRLAELCLHGKPI